MVKNDVDAFAIAHAAVHTHHAYQKVDELAHLLSLLQEQPPKNVVEIGTYRGGTLWAWSQVASPDALLVGIDEPYEPLGSELAKMLSHPRAIVQSPATYAHWLAHRLLPGYLPDGTCVDTYARGNQRIQLIKGNSHDMRTFHRLESTLDGRSIDFLFIDADHTYEGVREDFEMYSSLVSPKGLIAMHDIIDHTVPGCKVAQYWRDIRDSYHHLEVLGEHVEMGNGPWGGIGVLSKGVQLAKPR